ncbi:MAG: alpha/beta fold hydrolase, partial [Leptolyngbyaceae cyanobacterium SM1_4_3]|nr:alpha/beta fold hydrolase [Leptolyngbyaceae cyanobacterium SM1_4_3]
PVPKSVASILTAPPGPSPSELLPSVKAPLLVLWGEADPWTPIKGAKIYQDLAEQAIETGHSVQFASIPNAGHCPHDECPEKVNQLMLDWLNAKFPGET